MTATIQRKNCQLGTSLLIFLSYTRHQKYIASKCNYARSWFSTFFLNWKQLIYLIFWRLTSWYSCVWSKKWPQCNQQERTTLSRYGKNKDIRITTVFPIANLSVNSESSQHITMPITCFSVFFLSYTLIYRAPQQVTRTQWPIQKKIAFTSQADLSLFGMSLYVTRFIFTI